MADLPIIRDTLGEPPLDGDSIMLRTAPGQVSPLTHEQMDHNLYLLAKQCIANYNARQGKYVTAEAIKDGVIKAQHFQNGQIPPSAISNEFQEALVPPGTLFPYAGVSWSTTNTDFLLCDGSLVSTEQYSNLYSAISTIYDASPPSGKFRIPDFRGRFAVGAMGQAQNDNTRVECSVSDQVYGEEKHALTVGEMPAHTHDFVSARDHGSVDDGHNNANGFNRGVAVYQSDTLALYGLGMNATHRAYLQTHGEAAFRDKYPGIEPYRSPRPNTLSDNHFGGSFTGKPDGIGDNEPHTNVPPSIAVNYLIKT